MGCGSSVATKDLRKNSENFGAEKLKAEKHPTNRSSNTFSETVFRKNSFFNFFIFFNLSFFSKSIKANEMTENTQESFDKKIFLYDRTSQKNYRIST